MANDDIDIQHIYGIELSLEELYEIMKEYCKKTGIKMIDISPSSICGGITKHGEIYVDTEEELERWRKFISEIFPDLSLYWDQCCKFNDVYIGIDVTKYLYDYKFIKMMNLDYEAFLKELEDTKTQKNEYDNLKSQTDKTIKELSKTWTCGRHGIKHPHDCNCGGGINNYKFKWFYGFAEC